MRISSSTPADYMVGVSRLKIDLDPDDTAALRGASVPFRLPTLPGRKVRPDDACRAAPRGPDWQGVAWDGIFVDGVFEADVTSDGFAEHRNPTPVAKVEDALALSVRQMLDRFHGRE